jgi:hypothetical protein
MKERYHFEDLGINGRVLLKLKLKAQDNWEWTGFIWLRIWTGCSLLFLAGCALWIRPD